MHTDKENSGICFLSVCIGAPSVANFILMTQLTPIEARVLGVLIEKATTTPEQYPLSLNALTNGANQKNNRDPVLALTEEEIFDAVESLREKQFAVRVDQVGSRVHKYKHIAGETLHCSGAQLAVLAELLVRCPQTQGELRGRASRMHPIATLEDVQAILRGLIDQQDPPVQQLPPSPGSRAERYGQLLCPDVIVDTGKGIPTSAAASTPAARGVSDRVAALEAEIAVLRSALQKLAESIGAPDPFPLATIPGGSTPESPTNANDGKWR